mmetsp:Transcript_5985/g.14525  ORF Transcript_5985/g.14525 Transcript_5985/m.14525 type:complete len:220 (+) Transcript_5985:1752-2411(+)
MPSSSSDSDEVLRKALLRGLFQNTARRDPSGTYVTFDGHQTVSIHPSSALCGKKPDTIMFYEIVMTTKVYVRCVTAVDSSWLTEVVPDHFAAAAKSAVEKKREGKGRDKPEKGKESQQDGVGVDAAQVVHPVSPRLQAPLRTANVYYFVLSSLSLSSHLYISVVQAEVGYTIVIRQKHQLCTQLYRRQIRIESKQGNQQHHFYAVAPSPSPCSSPTAFF